MNMKFNSRGQTIIEALVALSIILLVITSISVVIISSLYNSQFIKEQNTANKYSQQGMEFMRSFQKNNLDQLVILASGTYCISGDALMPCGTPQILGNHNRIIDLTKDALPCATGEMRVTVTTSWASSKCASGTYCHESEITSCLVYNSGVTP